MSGDADGQRARLRAVLEAGLAVEQSGTVIDLPRDYPIGLDHPDLLDWETNEFTPDYATGAVR